VAEKEASIIVTLKDMASDGIGKMTKSFAGMLAGIVSVYTAVNTLKDFLVGSIKAYSESEDAVNNLNVALKNQGIYSAELSKQMQDYAKVLQFQTGISDEAILSAQTLLTTFGIAGSELKTATQAVIDLSAGMGIDLNSASLLVGKAFNGNVTALQRLGISIDKTIPSGERFAAVLGAIEGRFSGAAQAKLDTYSGKIQLLKIHYEELQETVGGKVVPILDRFLTSIITIVESMSSVRDVFFTLGQVLIQFFSEMVRGIVETMTNLPLFGAMMKDMGLSVDSVTSGFDSLQKKMDEWRTKGKKTLDLSLLDQRNHAKGAKANAQQELNNKLAVMMKEAAETKKYNMEVLAQEQQRIAATKLLRDTENAARLQSFQTALGQISTLQNAHNRQMVAVGKAAAIALAIMNTRVGATEALKVPPPWFGMALMGAVIAAGMAQVAQIMGVQMAEGGIVLPRSGGTLATLGEAGKAEAVIPLDSDQAGGMIGGVTINISAGVLLGSRDSVKELAKMIDQELFRMVKNRQSLAFGALT
jgi:hypothetical protein